MDLMDILKSQLSEGVLNQLTKQIGGNDTRQTAQAADGIMEVLLGSIAKNAQKEEGLAGLSNALDRDHDGSILDQLEDVMAGNNIQPQQQRSLNGAGILKHVLGNNMGSVIDLISKSSGLNGQQSGSLLEKLAPVVLGTLGKQKRQSNMNQNGLGELLGSVLNQQQQRPQKKSGGLLRNLIDQDGDGKIIDDVAGMLGKFLKK